MSKAHARTAECLSQEQVQTILKNLTLVLVGPPVAQMLPELPFLFAAEFFEFGFRCTRAKRVPVTWRLPPYSLVT
ncbi:hypothetical protein M2280_001079 [Prescottella agglutinans]|uniref:Uncharacterized protein n=1 Tax=Prescottella agglutinans TaxID=1644129 RepID=A0ABT6M6E6_9NOCA|nr:hypothetical protein [Prescottella agglutinans]